jgi:DNA-binding response OmpR family regulator
METPSRKTILIVEDERDVVDLLTLNLRKNGGFGISVASDGVAGLSKARSEKPAFIILDLMLPKMPGLEVCKILKSDPATRQIPIMMLTAKAEEIDRIVGLEFGADDYVTKPFSPRELLARVRAALRRTSRSATAEVNAFDGISVDFVRMEVTRDGQSIGLTAQEFKTLKFLLQNAERVISRDELLNEVWGYQNYPSTRTVDNHILKLRQKLEKDPANPVHFRTVHGVGYKFVP